MVRVAVVDYENCHPDRCGTPCVKVCPVNRTRSYKAIEISQEKKGKPVINEEFCIACGLCVKRCPYSAISIVNLPDEFERFLIHRFGPNAFKLYGIPRPVYGSVVGVIGKNGIGKTTAMKILAGEIIPNFGDFTRNPDRDAVLKAFRGTEYYNYFYDLYNGKLRVVHKIQNIEIIPKYIRGAVRDVLERIDERKYFRDVVEAFALNKILDKQIAHLSGGELQKLAIAAALLRDANVHIFDEPSSYLDIRERLRIAIAISSLLPSNAYALVVDHDLVFLDYISKYVVLAFGHPGVYGVFSKVYSTGAGINHFLEGYLPSENVRIRDDKIEFRLRDAGLRPSAGAGEQPLASWSNLKVSLNGFVLTVEDGNVYSGEVIGIVGPNGIGKTTFIRTLVGELQPESGYSTTTAFRLSYKPQYIYTVRLPCDVVEECIANTNKEALNSDNWLFTDVIKRLGIDRLLRRRVGDLSGGELQKLHISLTLIREADIYLLDEPSAHVDVEDQLAVARAIKKVTQVRRAASFVVEHNVLLLDHVADRIMVFSGTPGVQGFGSSPLAPPIAMNAMLKELNVTFRRDPKTGRPRMNKLGSYLDRYQKSIGEYFYSAPLGSEEES